MIEVSPCIAVDGYVVEVNGELALNAYGGVAAFATANEAKKYGTKWCDGWRPETLPPSHQNGDA